MFAVDAAGAKAVRCAFLAGGELGAVVDLHRRYPGALDDVAARLHIRAIAGGPAMTDQIIDAKTAQALYRDAVRAQSLAAWLVMKDQPEYPGKLIARLTTNTRSSYVLVADTLNDLRTLIPTGLKRSKPRPRDPPEVLEMWFRQIGTTTQDRR
jgi:hypothetical protein